MRRGPGLWRGAGRGGRWFAAATAGGGSPSGIAAAAGAEPLSSAINPAGGATLAVPDSAPYTVYVATTFTTQTGTPGIWSQGGAGANQDLIARIAASGTGVRFDRVNSSNTFVGTNVTPANVAANVRHVIAATVDTGGSALIVDNGTRLTISGAMKALNNAALYIAVRDSATYAQTTVHAAYIFASVHDETTMRAVSTWLAAQ